MSFAKKTIALKFDYSSIDLPISEIIPEVQNTLQTEKALIVSAPAGAGKSTLLPLALLGSKWLSGKKIIMLEPRRLAARAVAERMSELLGEKAGQTVGYRVRYETRVTESTRLEVVTEGILTRMLQSDNELSEAGLVIFDEFHERSIHADLALALTKECQRVLRDDLRILLMSATIDSLELSKILGCKAIASEGRLFPVEKKLMGDADMRSLPEMTTEVIRKAFFETEGDILVFLPGKSEIHKTESLVKASRLDAYIVTLYGALPFNKQAQAIKPDPSGRRKIVLSTSIAETSLTIEGIKAVVDCGFARVSRFDPRSGLSRLDTIQITRDSSDQRAGRAGRLSPGKCYQMWSNLTDQHLLPSRIPEILEADLGSLVLELAAWGIEDPEELSWITPPPSGAVSQAKELLHQIDALDKDRITDHGREMLNLPCHPRIAHMLIMSKDQDQIELATDLAAVLEEKDPLGFGAGIDINVRIEELRRSRSRGSDGGKFRFVERAAKSYRQLLYIEPDNESFDPYETGVLISYVYPERIACARPGNNAQFQLANGKLAMAGHKDDLAQEAWLAVAHLDARDGMGKIFLASQLNPVDLKPMIRETKIIDWNTKTGGLSATRQLRIGTIVLKSVPLPDPDQQELETAILEAVKKEGEHLLDFDDQTVQLMHRVQCMRRWRPTEKWPEYSLNNLLRTADKWLTPYISKVKTPADLRKISLKEILFHQLDYDLQQTLSNMAPEKIKVPSGSLIGLEYRSDGDSPILAVRIQELFGMDETPKVNNGKVRILLHLLSPGFKPVQVTDDLNSFWSNTYFEVRKELKRRYPKHVWPDEPQKAKATTKTKKQLQKDS